MSISVWCDRLILASLYTHLDQIPVNESVRVDSFAIVDKGAVLRMREAAHALNHF